MKLAVSRISLETVLQTDLSWAEAILLAKYSARKRRPPHPPLSMLKALIFQKIRQIQSWRKLSRELRSSPQTVSALGLRTAPCFDSFSEFTKRLGPETLRMIITRIVQQIRGALPSFGEIAAFDSTLVKGYSNGRRRFHSDPDAKWGVSTVDAGRPKYIFGYKLHMASDATYGLPMAYMVTSANRSDSPVYPKVLKNLVDFFITPRFTIADAGYDSKTNMFLTLKKKAIPIIALNPRRSKNKRGRRADYLLPVPRHSELWNHLYSMRSSVERVFSRLKGELGLERLLLRSLERVEVHFALTIMAMLSLVLASLISGQDELIRSIEPWRYWQVLP